MSEIKNTMNMTLDELKEYYKNNKTISERLLRAETLIREGGVADES